MSVNDPIADMLTRIRNGVMAGQMVVAMPSSNIKAEIARILKEEGYIESFEVVDGDAEHPAHKTLRVRLKYVGERRQSDPSSPVSSGSAAPDAGSTPTRRISRGFSPGWALPSCRPRRVS